MPPESSQNPFPNPFQSPAGRSRLDDLLGRHPGEGITGIDLRYSRLVKRLRLLLPVFAAILAVIVFIVAGPEDINKPVSIESLEPQVGKNELVTPRFESQDENAQPYSVTANRAYQKSEDLNVVELEDPVADMTMKDDTWLALKAQKGEFLQDQQKLSLTGNVRLFHDQGYELLTDQVNIDIPKQTAISTVPVRGHGPVGRIKAAGFEARGDASTLRFTGPAKLTLYPDQGRAKPLQPVETISPALSTIPSMPE